MYVLLQCACKTYMCFTIKKIVTRGTKRKKIVTRTDPGVRPALSFSVVRELSRKDGDNPNKYMDFKKNAKNARHQKVPLQNRGRRISTSKLGPCGEGWLEEALP